MNTCRTLTHVWLLLIVGTASAQPVVTTTYEHDSVGNRISATNLLRFTGTRVFSFAPSVATRGEPVNIFGRNLPPGNAVGFTVTFSGAAANILSVGTNVLNVKVPNGATSGPLVVTLPDNTVVELGTFLVTGIAVRPVESVVSFSQTLQFTAIVNGVDDENVTWEVLPVPNGVPGANIGTIDNNGLYTPPPITDLTVAPEVLISVTSLEHGFLSAFAIVRLFGTSAASGGPRTILLPAPGDPGGLPLNVTVPVYGPALDILLPATGDAGGLNVTVPVYGPALGILLPATGDAGGLPLNVTVGNPREITVETEDSP